MLKIGEFAWLSQVTVETLRHYDRIGLLKPAHLDQSNGYRYYTLAQLPRLNRILALKDIGLHLEKIEQILDQNIPASEIRAILERKQTELEGQIQEAQSRLARIEARLEHIDLEDKMPDFEILTKTIKNQWIAAVRETINSWNQDIIGPTFTRMFDEVEAYLRSKKVKPVGPGIALYHHQSYHHQSLYIDGGFDEAFLDVESAMVVEAPMPESDRIKVRELPQIEVAYTIHHGDFSGLPLAKQAIFSWLEASDYLRAGPIREVYLHFDPNHEANYDSPHHITEIQFPIERK